MIMLLNSQKSKETYVLVPFNGDYTETTHRPTNEHYHSIYHIIITVDGIGVLEKEGFSTIINERSIVLIDPQERHIFYSSSEEATVTYFSFNFYLLHFDSIFSTIELSENIQNITYLEDNSTKRKLSDVLELTLNEEDHIIYRPANWDKIALLMHNLEQAFLSHNARSPFSQDEKLEKDIEFINFGSNTLLSFYDLFKQSGEQPFSPREYELLTNVNAYFEASIHKPYSLKTLADFLNYSPSYLCRIFKNTTGYTLNEYFDKMKINKACHLIATTDYSLSLISDLLGYSSASHFSKNFREQMGISPSKFSKFY